MKILAILIVCISAQAQLKSLPAGANAATVLGPASSTDNAICRFDGTTGKTIQNTSMLTVSDLGLISITPVGTSGDTAFIDMNNESDTNPEIHWNTSAGGNGVIFRGPSGAALYIKDNLTTLVSGIEAITGVFRITDAGTIRPALITADPCANATSYPEGGIWWDDTNNKFCTCLGGADVQLINTALACF